MDDDESVRRHVGRRAVAADRRADISSGQESLDLIEAMPSFQPACLILDVQMSGMDGLEVQDRLAASGHAIRMIFITAHDEIGVARSRWL